MVRTRYSPLCDYSHFLANTVPHSATKVTPSFTLDSAVQCGATIQLLLCFHSTKPITPVHSQALGSPSLHRSSAKGWDCTAVPRVEENHFAWTAIPSSYAPKS